MTDPHIPVTEDELHAYVDNELPAERRGDVEAWLAAHPDEAARVQSWRTMAEALHARYDSVVDEATRNVRVQAVFDNAGEKLRPGMYVEAKLSHGGSTPVVMIPASAVVYAPFGDSGHEDHHDQIPF